MPVAALSSPRAPTARVSPSSDSATSATLLPKKSLPVWYDDEGDLGGDGEGDECVGSRYPRDLGPRSKRGLGGVEAEEGGRGGDDREIEGVQVALVVEDEDPEDVADEPGDAARGAQEQFASIGVTRSGGAPTTASAWSSMALKRAGSVLAESWV
jgi:hypothetical protein